MGIRLFRVVVAAGVLLAGIVVAGPTGAATPTAVVVPSPSPGTNVNYLNGVACVSDTDCWAVGYFEVSAKQHTLVEHWDGMQWLVVPSPNVASMENSQLARSPASRARTASRCGDSWTLPSDDLSATLDTLIERWDGSTWSIVPSPNGDPSHVGLYRFLESVTCPSLARCIAVGHTETGRAEPHVRAAVGRRHLDVGRDAEPPRVHRRPRVAVVGRVQYDHELLRGRLVDRRGPQRRLPPARPSSSTGTAAPGRSSPARTPWPTPAGATSRASCATRASRASRPATTWMPSIRAPGRSSSTGTARPGR